MKVIWTYEFTAILCEQRKKQEKQDISINLNQSNNCCLYSLKVKI